LARGSATGLNPKPDSIQATTPVVPKLEHQQLPATETPAAEIDDTVATTPGHSAIQEPIENGSQQKAECSAMQVDKSLVRDNVHEAELPAIDCEEINLKAASAAIDAALARGSATGLNPKPDSIQATTPVVPKLEHQQLPATETPAAEIDTPVYRELDKTLMAKLIFNISREIPKFPRVEGAQIRKLLAACWLPNAGEMEAPLAELKLEAKLQDVADDLLLCYLIREGGKTSWPEAKNATTKVTGKQVAIPLVKEMAKANYLRTREFPDTGKSAKQPRNPDVKKWCTPIG
jgi:hypothetical protein